MFSRRRKKRLGHFYSFKPALLNTFIYKNALVGHFYLPVSNQKLAALITTIKKIPASASTNIKAMSVKLSLRSMTSCHFAAQNFEYFLFCCSSALNLNYGRHDCWVPVAVFPFVVSPLPSHNSSDQSQPLRQPLSQQVYICYSIYLWYFSQVSYTAGIISSP